MEIHALYHDYQEMLRRERPEIVRICTPVSSHCEITTACARAGVKAILCEKPMALDMEGAESMIAECAQAGAKLAIGHMRRHSAHHQFVKRFIDRGELGKLSHLSASCPSNFMEWGTHFVDLMLWYAGEVEWVMGQIHGIGAPRHRFGFIDVAPVVGYFKFASGAVGLLETAISGTRDEDCSQLIHIRGERGELVVPLAGSEHGAPRYCRDGSLTWIAPEIHHVSAFQLEIENLCDCIEQDKTPLADGRSGMKALEVLLAITESARTRGKVSIPLRQRKNPLEIMMNDGLQVAPQVNLQP